MVYIFNPPQLKKESLINMPGSILTTGVIFIFHTQWTTEWSLKPSDKAPAPQSPAKLGVSTASSQANTEKWGRLWGAH